MNYKLERDEMELTQVEVVVFGACVGAMLFILTIAIYS